MSDPTSILPAMYWRATENWACLVGKTGMVIAATQVQVGLPELESSAPYWLILIRYDDPGKLPPLQLFVGADGYGFHENDQVRCVLRRFSSLGDGLIHYGIKVSPAKT